MKPKSKQKKEHTILETLNHAFNNPYWYPAYSNISRVTLTLPDGTKKVLRGDGR